MCDIEGLTYGSLFSGYCGLDEGVQSVLGGDTVWVSEFDPDASRVLAHNYPGVPNLGDMTKIDWDQVEPVDVLTGGSPCQDLSHAGRRKGMTDGTRSNLWVTMREAIAVLRPRLVVWENVRGAYSAHADSGLEHCPRCVGDPRDGGSVLRALGRVLGDLSDLGYDAQWHGLRAADVGGAHGRFRVFVFATPADTDRAGFSEHGGSVPVRAEQSATQHVGADVAHVPGQLTLLPTPRVTDGSKGGPNQRGSSGDLMLPLAVNLLPTPSVADTTGGRKSRSGDRSNELLLNGIAAAQDWGAYEAAIRRCETAWGRKAPAPTQPCPKEGQRLSARFVEFLMGLPEGHVTDPTIWVGKTPSAARNAQLKILGNGVVPQQAAAATRLWLGHPLPTTGAPSALLPTPAVNDMGAAYTPATWDAWTDRMKTEHGNGNGHGKSLTIEALRLQTTSTNH